MPIATYDVQRDRWAFLHDCYRGGSYYRNPSATRLGSVSLAWNAPARQGEAINTSGTPIPRSAIRKSYLLPHAEEADVSFDSRHALSAHIPIVTPVVKAYAESVTATVTRATPGVPDAVMRDVNLSGASWETWVDESARWFALFGLGFAVVDAPRATQPINSLADQQQMGVRPYAMLIQPAAVALVECDDWGALTRFAYADEPYYPRNASAGTTDYQVCLREWSTTAHEGAPGWRKLRGTLSVGVNVDPIHKQIDHLYVEDSGPLAPQLMGKLPVAVGYYERDSSSVTPQGVSLVDDIADIERLVYNMLSWCSEIHRAAGFPFLTIPQGATGGQMDPNTAITIGPARAVPYSSSTGKPEWIQPSAESTKELREHMGFLFQVALRGAGMELASDASAQVQSGEALRIKSRDFDSRCSRFAGQMASFEKSVLRLLAMLSGAGDPGDAIVVEYAKRFTLPDSSEDLARSISLLGLRSTGIDIGDEATVELIKQALNAALPSLSPEKLASIVVELMQRYGATSQFQKDAMARDAEMGAAQLDAATPKPLVAADPTQNLPEIFAYHIEMGIVTRNEVRERLGFQPLPGGDVMASVAAAEAQAQIAGATAAATDDAAAAATMPPA